MEIRNREKLATTGLRRAALRIAEAGIAAIGTPDAIRRAVSFKDGALRVKDDAWPLVSGGKLIVVGAGKCSLEAAAALEDVLGNKISGGAVIDTRPGTLKRIKAFAGDHPFPSERNMAATKEVIAALQGLTDRDLVLAVISGGGSTLLCQPASPELPLRLVGDEASQRGEPQNHSCLEEKKFLQCLFRAGATIEEINTVRKHTSSARGGWLAKHAYPARVVSLIFSDVPGDKEEWVASGPTVLDETTTEQAEEVLRKYNVRGERGLEEMELMETPKEKKYFEKVRNILLVSNRLALQAMAEAADKLGFSVDIRTTEMRGEAREAGEKVAAELAAAPARTALLYGGETTVIIRGSGKGGRNRELALAALGKLRAGELVLALASDGRDNGAAAGALCDMMTKEKADKLGLAPGDFLQENDSERFFQQTGDEILLGATGANVSDLSLAIKE